MKKTILKLPLVICLITASCYLYLQKDHDLNNLVIKNIEALAEDEYYEVVIAALAAINVNLAFNSEESVIDLSLTSILALASDVYKRQDELFIRIAPFYGGIVFHQIIIAVTHTETCLIQLYDIHRTVLLIGIDEQSEERSHSFFMQGLSLIHI